MYAKAKHRLKPARSATLHRKNSLKLRKKNNLSAKGTIVKCFFIVNPKSGKRDITDEVTQKVKAFFGDRTAEYEIIISHDVESKSHTTENICKSNIGTPIRICACGGDGTLNGVASGASGYKDVEIGYYPAGSGNDFIKCFATADDYRSVEHFVNWKSRPVDMLKVNDIYCLNLLSVGVDADVNYCLPKYRRIPLLGGPMAYNMSVLENFFKPMGKELKITIDGEPLSGKYMLIAMGNGRVYGGGYYATPEAEFDDGIMDIVLIDKISKLKIVGVLGTYKKGEHIKNGCVAEEMKGYLHYYHAKNVTVESGKEFVVNVDGEAFVSSKLTVGMMEEAIRFIAP